MSSKKHFFLKKNGKTFAGFQTCRTFAAQLGIGVMVTLQILVLSFLVRVRDAQQGERLMSLSSFFVRLHLHVGVYVAQLGWWIDSLL